MELQLQPRSHRCSASGVDFQEGDRVVSVLAQAENELRRFDCLAAAEERMSVTGEILCRWSRTYKQPVREANPERKLKMTAESLFLSLTEEGSAVEENADLKRFLALMLERKRVLRPRGRNSEGSLVYYHAGANRMVEVPGGELDAAFFVAVREKLDVLLGAPPGAAQPEQ